MSNVVQHARPILAVVMLAASLGLFACNDNPTTIGEDYLPQNVKLFTYKMQPSDFEITSGISVASNSSAEGGSAILVGHAPDGSTAHSLIAITTQSSLISGASAKPVKSAVLAMRTTHYRYGDTASRQIAFDVVVLDEVFSSNVKWTPELAARIDAATAIGSFSGTYPDDTTLAVALDPTLTQKFLQEYFTYDTVSGIAQFRTLKTLALRAKSDGRIIGAINGIAGVDAAYIPHLNVTVNTTTADSTASLTVGATSWITDAKADVGPNKIVVAAGAEARTLIKLKLDSIPNTGTIHQAELRLFVDRSKTVLGNDSLTTYLIAYLAADSSLTPSSYLSTGIGGIFTVFRMTDPNAGTFRFTTLAPAVSTWLRNLRGASTVKNYGVILAFNRGNTGANLETTTLDKIVFHGPDDPDPALRPSLTIYYSVQTDAK